MLRVSSSYFRDPEPDQKLQDLVNKTMWKKCCFSGDGEYVCAGSARQHALYIWEKQTGTLMKILHGTKGEILHDVVVIETSHSPWRRIRDAQSILTSLEPHERLQLAWFFYASLN